MRAVAILAMLVGLAAGAARAEEPVKLGMILDMSGVYADVTGPGSVTGARLAIEDFGGKVLGRPIELMVADHQNKPDIAAATAARWFDSEHVTAILDVSASSPALAVINTARSRHAIVILNGPGASSITGEQCMPTTALWSYNTYALGKTTGQAILADGGKSWYFIAADYTFGAQLEGDTAAVVKAGGGTVVGDAKAPLGTDDFSAYLLKAQQSGAQVIGFANGGNDLVNAIKQAADFQLNKTQKMAALLAYITDIHSIGIDATQGLLLSSAWYWNQDDAARAYGNRFYARMKKMPNMAQAGVYSSTTHYLEAVQAVGSLDSQAVMQKMRDTPVDDFFTHGGHLRADGMMVHDMYLFQVKTPAESKGEWDLYKQISKVAGDDAYLPLADSRCPLAKR